MTPAVNDMPPVGDPAADRRARRLAWLWFAPPFALGLLRFWLETRAEALPAIWPIAIAPYVQAAPGHDAAALRALMWQASQPLLMTVATLAAVILILWRSVRRWGWRRVTPVITALWCVLCAGAAAGLVAIYVNHAGLAPLPPVTATVIAAQPYPSTDKAPGGALTWLQPPNPSRDASDGDTPWRVRLEGADFQALPPGARVTLQRARGALWGVYLTGSDAPQAQPMPSVPPLPDAAPVPPPGAMPDAARTPPADPS